MDFLATAAKAQAGPVVYFPTARTTENGRVYEEELLGIHYVSFFGSSALGMLPQASRIEPSAVPPDQKTALSNC